MNISLYIPPFLASFLISVVIAASLIRLARRFPFLKHGKVSRLGGLAIIAAFVVAILTDRNLFISVELWAVIIASVYILLAGLIDDFRNLHWKYQLFLQVMAAVFIFIVGIRIEYVTNPLGGIIDFEGLVLPSLFFGIIWIILVMNAFNWTDGSDGLSGGVAFIAALTIFFLSLKPEVNQPPVGIITMALAGAILGFLVFNFYPAKIYAGTSGSMFMGFIIAVLAIFAGAKIATALLVMAVPVIDFALVIIKRLRSGQSVFHPDKNHFHFQLEKLGWSPSKIALFFYFVTAAIAIVALNTRSTEKALSIILVFLFISSVIIYFNRKNNVVFRKR